jgi:hypothetical protein
MPAAAWMRRAAGWISGEKHKILHRTFPLAPQNARCDLKIAHTILFYPKRRIYASAFCVLPLGALTS